MATKSPGLFWESYNGYKDAILGDFEGGDGVRFNLTYRGSCYRRGRYCLLIEVAPGEDHFKWGCFDAQDQPTRYYHDESNAMSEAQLIANVLWSDRFMEVYREKG